MGVIWPVVGSNLKTRTCGPPPGPAPVMISGFPSPSTLPALWVDGYENVLASQLVLEPALQIPTATVGLWPNPVPLMATWLLVVRPVSGVTDVSEAPPEPPLSPTAASAASLRATSN